MTFDEKMAQWKQRGPAPKPKIIRSSFGRTVEKGKRIAPQAFAGLIDNIRKFGEFRRVYSGAPPRDLAKRAAELAAIEAYVAAHPECRIAAVTP